MSWTVHRRIASREKASDNRGQSGHPNLAEAPSVTAKKFYYDTVCYGSKAAFICALVMAVMVAEIEPRRRGG